EVKGHMQTFQNRLQMVLHEVKKSEVDEKELKCFVGSHRANPEVVFTEVIAFVAKVENLHIRALLQNTLTDPQLKILLMSAPAAKSIHHAYIGGLMEHILSILKVMESLASHYHF